MCDTLLGVAGYSRRRGPTYGEGNGWRERYRSLEA